MGFKQFHYYHQIEQSDCGVTCLRMVARHFGRKIPVKFLRSRADLSRGGISIRGLKEYFCTLFYGGGERGFRDFS